MPALFVSTDLVFSSRLAAAGARLGFTISAVSSIDAALTRVETDSVDLVICDLSSLGTEAKALVGLLREQWPSLPIVAYAPHVHEQRLRAATEAGCNEVFTRGQFDRQMDDILTRYLTPR